jgi:hypothetical protein
MADKERYDLLEKFANDTSIAKGGDIQVSITPNCTSMKPKGNDDQAMRAEDCNLLSEIIRGADHLLFWLGRNGYEIKKKRKK